MGGFVTDTDLAYAAGFIDGEGSFFSVGKRRADGTVRLRPAISASNCQRAAIDKLVEMFGGSVYCKPQRGTRREIWEWRVTGERARAAALAVLPFLVLKRPQAEIVLAFEIGRVGRSVTPEENARRDALAASLKSLNRVGVGA